jgi:septal ring factor EnvC (AmiA/AmiB activator)
MTARPPNERIATRSTAALDVRVAELEDELFSTLEDLVILKNENQSLQASLDLIVAENVRLSRCFAESDTELRKVRSQIERLKAVLGAAERGRNEPAVATAVVDEEPKSKRFNRLEPMAPKPPGASAEKLLSRTITFTF